MTAKADIARLLDLRSGFTRDDLVLDGKGSEVQLGRALTDAQVERTMEGASTVTLTVADSDWSLAGESELLGEKRLKSDLNLEIDDLVFTLNELEKIDDGWSMVFYDEPTTALRDHKRRMKATRDTVTRAQFFGMLCKAAGVRLYSIEKNVKQPVAALDKADAKQLRDSKKAVKTATQKAREKKAAKVPAKEARVYKRLKGPASWFGRVSAQGAIDPGDPSGQTKSGKPNYAKGVAVNAYPSMGYAGAVKSYNEFQGSWWRCTCPNGRVGVFQHIDQGPNADGRVVDFTASALADIGYTVLNFPTSAGTFKLENLGRNYDQSGSGSAGSGASSGNATTERARVAKYEFSVETGEDYQETGQRLADEVGWRCFSNGTGYVFDSDLTLAKADPSMVLVAGTEGVDRIRWTWTRRALIDELQVDVRLVPWAAPPGAVALVKGEGPADGKWLVRSIQAPLLGEDRQATATLGRPQKPRKEPAPSVETVSASSGSSAGLSKIVLEAKKISAAGGSYLLGGGHGAPLRSLRSGQPLDCSSSASLALYRAGFFKGTVAQVSGELAASYGQAGEGKNWTVWANADHVFLMGKDKNGVWRFDTGGPGGGNGPRFHREGRPTAGFTPRHWPGE